MGFKQVCACFLLTLIILLSICALTPQHPAQNPSVIVPGTYLENKTLTTTASTELINWGSFTSANIASWISACTAQGLTEFTLRINAFTDWSDGALSSSTESKAKEIITAAVAASIDVNIDLHTWYTTWDTYFDDSASGHDANRSTYKNFVADAVTKLDVTGVSRFMVLNEPQAQTATASENTFILEVIQTAHALTAKPVSVRFMGGYSPSTGHYSSAIDTACDFICRNTYWDPRNPTVTVYGSTEAKLLAAIAVADAQSKEFWVTEFGKSASNPTEQKNYVVAFLAWCNIEGVDRAFAWASSPTASETYNIIPSFTPNPAWYELVSTTLSNDTNLGDIPDDWGNYPTLGDIYYGSGTQITSYDTTVERTASAGSAKITDWVEGCVNTAREINTNNAIPCKAGDTILFKCYMKTGSGTGNGARTGLDFYASNGRICSLQSDGASGVYPNESATAIVDHYVDWGTSSWTLRTITFTVPVTLTADGWSGLAEGTVAEPVAVLPWLQAVSTDDNGNAWFADAELYINPTSTPPDTITITASDDANSTISPAGAISVNYGDSKMFTWTTNSGYVIDTITVDGNTVSNMGSYTFLNNITDHTIAITSTVSNVLFSDGFESGDLSAWSGNTVTTGETIAASTTQKKTGVYSAKCDSNGGGGTENAYVYHTLASTQAELYIRCYVYIGTNGVDANGDFLDFMRIRVSTTLLAHFGIRQTSGNIRWWSQCRDGTSYVDTYASTGPSTGQWYLIEGHWKEHATTGGVEMWVNGVSVLSTWTRDTDNYGDATRCAFGLAETSGVAASTVYVDNCVVSTSPIGQVANRPVIISVMRMINGA